MRSAISSQNQVTIEVAVARVAQDVASFLPAEWPIALIEFMIGPALRLNQCHLERDAAGGLLSLTTWAFVSASLDAELASGARRTLHPSEWNEGTHAWIIDHFSRALVPLSARLAITDLARHVGSVKVACIDAHDRLRLYRVTSDGGRAKVRRV